MKRLFLAAVAAVAVSACAPAASMKSTTLLPTPPEARRSQVSAELAGNHFDAGYRMYQRGQYRQASRAFERALANHPANHQAAYFLGMSHLNRTRYTDARRAFRLGLELATDCQTIARIHVAMAYSYEAVRFTRKAHQHYHLACESYKANQYAQIGAKRTEYVHAPSPRSR